MILIENTRHIIILEIYETFRFTENRTEKDTYALCACSQGIKMFNLHLNELVFANPKYTERKIMVHLGKT